MDDHCGLRPEEPSFCEPNRGVDLPLQRRERQLQRLVLGVEEGVEVIVLLLLLLAGVVLVVVCCMDAPDG